MKRREPSPDLSARVAEWRAFLANRSSIGGSEAAELEDHLWETIEGLLDSGLAEDEAFLVAVKRLGAQDELAREFASEHSERLWKQLILAPEPLGADAKGSARAMWEALGFSLAAALAIKLPSAFGLSFDGPSGFYLRNLGFFAFPFIAAFFARRRGLGLKQGASAAILFLLAALPANLYPFAPDGSTEVLLALHLPTALWFGVGFAYVGGRWRDSAARMDFIRFSGELFIYYVLIALGGGVLMGFSALIFGAIGLDIEPVFESWILPTGAMGGLVIAAWLVEAKKSVIENMAPVLTRIFTPLFALMLLAFLAALAWTGRGFDVERELLIAFDLLLIAVLALLVYSISAREREARPGFFDVLQNLLILGALASDGFALAAMAGRIREFGLSPNRSAALGLNILLLVNLAWSAWLYLGFMRGRKGFSRLEAWQTAYLPVWALWAALVALAFPPLFGFM